MVALAERATPSGQDLLAEFIKYGHQRPFEEIVRRYAGMVFNVCLHVTKDKHEAEDATQAVFLTLALQAKRGTEIKAIGPWLQQVAKRLSLDLRRGKKRRKTREQRHHHEQTTRRISIDEQAIPSADLDELKTILHEELQKLPAKYRLPLILHYFGGMNRDEMAAELNCKASTLGVRIFRGREMLAGRLSGRGIQIAPPLFALAMSWAVKRAISDPFTASTSYAATAMAAGHSGAGYASANVIELTRRAAGAAAIGKVKIAALTLLIAASSLGAGAKELGVLPNVNVQFISEQMQRLMRSLIDPLFNPMRADAGTSATPISIGTNLTRTSSTNLAVNQSTSTDFISKPTANNEGENLISADIGRNAQPPTFVAIEPATSWTNSMLAILATDEPSLLAESAVKVADGVELADDSVIAPSTDVVDTGPGTAGQNSAPLPVRLTTPAMNSTTPLTQSDFDIANWQQYGPYAAVPLAASNEASTLDGESSEMLADAADFSIASDARNVDRLAASAYPASENDSVATFASPAILAADPVSSESLPEPEGLSLVVISSALLLRRRR